MISSTSNEMPSLMVHTPTSLEVSSNQFSTHQEPEVSRSPTVARIPIANSWPEINGNATHTDPEDEEVDVMDIVPSNSVQAEPVIANTSSVNPPTEKADDTETSSGYDLAESGISDSEKSKIKKKWNKQKYNVAWRWSWLQLQSAELQHQLQQCDASVSPSQSISNNTANNHNNETATQPSTTSTFQSIPSSPFIPKYQKKQPQTPHHPLFPAKADNKKRVGSSPDPTSVRHKRLKQLEYDDPTRRILSRSTNSILNPMNSESPIASPRLKRNNSRTDKFNIDHVVIPCTVSPGPPLIPKDVPTPKWRDFGNDPFEGLIARSHSMESTSPCISPSFRRTKSTNDVNLARSLSVEFPKEDTQDFSKSIDIQQSADISTEAKHEILDSTSPHSGQNGFQDSLSLSTSTTFLLSQKGVEVEQKREFHLIRSDSGSSLASQTGNKSDGSSSEEDTSDEAFMVRHFCRELLERRRLFKANQHDEGWKCPNDLQELPTLFWQSPEDYFKTKLRCRNQEARAKLKEKFTRIRSRYVNPCTVMMDWEQQGVESERILAERAHELKQREALLASSSILREHREPRVRIIDADEQDEEEHNSYCASSEEEEDFFDQYSESSEGSGSQELSDESQDMLEFDEDSDGEYRKYTRRYDLTTSTGRRKGRNKKRKKMMKQISARRGRPKQLNQFSPEFGRWEIVRKTPPLDPITNQLRNIIYLRRVREHTQSAD